MRVAVTLVGRRVRAMLAAARDGTVLAVFRRSLYVRDVGGAIACFGVPGLGAGPLNALCASWPDDTITPGTLTHWTDQALQIGDKRFDCAAAITWQPPAIVPADPTAGLRLLTDITRTDVPARGLGRAIDSLLTGTPWTTGDPFEQPAGDGVSALTRWLAAPAGDPPPAVERLIGLGPGLTPSGDDALGGALVALRAFGAAPRADGLARWALPRARGATSDISFAHLAAAADGEGAAALHDTLVALAQAERPALVDGVRRLDAIGHSSGWDALAGAVAALVALPRG